MTDASGAVWPPPALIRVETLPAHRLLAGEIPPEALRGKILFVGVSASGAGYTANIGRGLQAPGHHLHAATAAAILEGAAGYRASHFAPLEIVTAAIASLAALIAAVLGRRWTALAVLVGAPIAALVISWLGFTGARALIDATLMWAVMATIGLYLAAYALLSQRLAMFYERSFVGRVVGSMSDGVVVSGRDGGVISINPAAERLLAGRGVEALDAAPTDAGSTRHLVEPDARDASATTLEVDSAWIDDRGQPIRVQVVRDVTKLLEAEGAAELASARLAEAAAGMADGLALFDRHGRLAFHNPGVVGMVDAETAADLPSMSYDAFMAKAFEADPDKRALESFAARLVALETADELEDERSTAVGRWVLARERRTQEGGLVSLYIDITQLKEATEALRKAQTTAEQASEAKNRLLATVSHELRTPLNAILGFADAMRLQIYGPIENARYQDYLQHIMTSGSELLDLVENLLDVASAEEAEFAINLVPVDLARVADRLEATFKQQFEKAGVVLQIDVPNDLPPCMLDERAIWRVLSNLLSNALKYGGAPVRLAAEYSEEAGHNLTVSDAGPGMSVDAVAQAFDPFWQAVPHGRPGASGMGLGLTLVKTLTERQGGRVWIDSAPGAGAVFHVSFPPEDKR